MLQAPMFECLSLDPFSSFDDGGSPAEVGIGGCDVVEALVVALVVVMLDEGLDLLFEIARQEVILQQHTVFERLMPALDLALGLWVEGCAAHVAHLVGVDVFGQLARNVAGAIVAEQRGLCSTLAWSQSEAASAISSVSVTSSARMVVQSFHAMM